MKSVTKFKFAYLTSSLLLIVTTLSAQNYRNLTKPEREEKSQHLIANTSFIIGGVICSYRYFYGDDVKTIYTAITVNVINDYKESISTDSIILIKKGGIIGVDNQFKVHDSGPLLGQNQKYILLLKPNAYAVNSINFGKETFNLINENEMYSCGRYARTKLDKFYFRGFYDLDFSSEKELNNFLIDADKSINLKKKIIEKSPTQGYSPIVISTDLGTITVHAGLGEILTIEGSGFGTSGSVYFTDGDRPDYGFLFGLDDIYIESWIFFQKYRLMN